jgi:hypothetical protein
MDATLRSCSIIYRDYLDFQKKTAFLATSEPILKKKIIPINYYISGSKKQKKLK